MTVKEFAIKVCKSPSTIYRWIKKGLVKAFKKNRRWEIDAPTETQGKPEGKPGIEQDPAPEKDLTVDVQDVADRVGKEYDKRVQEWHPSIDRETAERDGLTAKDFNWLDYPLNRVWLDVHKGDLRFLCDFRKVPPLDKCPGINLSWVRFQLFDHATKEKLDEKLSFPNTDSKDVIAWATRRASGLWQRAPRPGKIEVLLVATPFFDWLKKPGEMISYAIGNNQHFTGYELACAATIHRDEDDNITLS